MSPETLVKGTNNYVLRVKGDSLSQDAICDGDYLIVRSCSTPADGDIVVALVGGVAGVVRRFHREPDGMVRLTLPKRQSASARHPADDVTVQGVVLAVIRKYGRAA